MQRPCRCAVLALVVFGSFLAAVDAHASLTEPRSRNVAYFTTPGVGPGQNFGEWWANNGNGLGPKISATDFLRPAGNPGVCGDPYQESPTTNLATFTGLTWPVTTFTAGQTFKPTVKLQVNHGGRITFRLCDRRSNLDQACFDGRTLLRADNNKPHYYILTGSFDNTVINRVPEFPVMPSYKLPDGFTCPNGCVLQMEYYTYNTCVEPCTDCGFYEQKMNYIIPPIYQGPKSYCSATLVPEIFRNCADIVINGGSPPSPCSSNPPTAVANGFWSCGASTTSGAACRATCSPGFTGAPSSTCSNGVWGSVSGSCISSPPTSCSGNPPTAVANGFWSCGASTTSGAACRATCSPGFTGAPSSTCSTGGLWGPVSGQCSSGCPPPSDPQRRATCFCTGKAPGRYQDVQFGCSGGFWCYSGGAQYITCVSGLLYDSRAGVCNWASAVQCTGTVVGPASVSVRRERRPRRGGAAGGEGVMVGSVPAVSAELSTADANATAVADVPAGPYVETPAVQPPVIPEPVVAVDPAVAAAAASNMDASAAATTPVVLPVVVDPTAAAQAVPVDAAVVTEAAAAPVAAP